jgi:hypothetical protein
MVADGSVEPKFFMGILETTLANGEIGRVIHFGQLSQFNTSAFQDGDVLWCDPAVPGGFTVTEPLGPNVKIAAAIVISASVNGKIKVRVQSNEGLHELHDVRITSQTDGEVLIWDNTLGVWKNNNTLIVDHADGRVGIGTNNPTQKLHVEGGSAMIQTGGSAALYLRTTNDANTSYRGQVFATYSYGNPFSITGYNDHAILRQRTGSSFIDFYTENNIRATLSGTGLGIGTTSPRYQLDLAKAQDSSQEDYIALGVKNGPTAGDGTSLGSGIIWKANFSGYTKRSAGIVQIAEGSYFRSGLAFYTNGTADTTTDWVERMRISQYGNVGIGTDSPNAKLDVVATGIAGLAKAAEFSSFGNGGTGRGTKITIGAPGTQSVVEVAEIIGYQNANSATADNAAFAINVANSSGVLTERLKINNSGNIGIGATSPSEKLDVYGNIKIGTTANSNFLNRSDTHWVQYNGGTTTNNTYVRVASVNATTIGKTISLWTDAVNRFEVKANGDSYFTGNVGIGTTSPSATLDVRGSGGSLPTTNSVDIAYFSKSGSGGIQIISGSGATSFVGFGDTTARSKGGISYNSTTNFLAFAADSAERMRLDASGNLGIGTDSPSALLHLKDNFTNGVAVVYDRTENAIIDSLFYTGVSSAGAVSTDFMWMGTGTTHMSLTGTGNVGIGTTTPGFKLEVVGTVKASTYLVTPLIYSGGGNVVFGNVAQFNDWVGIGVTSPKSKLDINGTIALDSKSMSISDTFATALTINMNPHTGCYVKITAFGDWSGHSSVAYLGEFFIQHGSDGYKEPGTIIRQVDNTNTDSIEAKIVDPVGVAVAKNFTIQLRSTSSSSTPFTIYLQYEVRGQFNSVS